MKAESRDQQVNVTFCFLEITEFIHAANTTVLAGCSRARVKEKLLIQI